MALSSYYRAFRVSVNGFTFWMLLMAGITVLPISTLTGVLLIIASIDAFFDVLAGVGVKLKQMGKVLRALNYFTEGTSAVVGGLLVAYGMMYMNYFESWFFKSLIIVGAITLICSILDITTEEPFITTMSIIRQVLSGGKYVLLKERKK